MSDGYITIYIRYHSFFIPVFLLYIRVVVPDDARRRKSVGGSLIIMNARTTDEGAECFPSSPLYLHKLENIPKTGNVPDLEFKLILLYRNL